VVSIFIRNHAETLSVEPPKVAYKERQEQDREGHVWMFVEESKRSEDEDLH